MDVSTVSPRVSRELAERASERSAALLDAPVSGSVPQVQSGNADDDCMVGGDDDAYRRVEPVLRELGTPTHVGENGQGLALKLAINISLAVQMLAYSEGLLLATRFGVDPTVASRVMTESPIGSPMLKARAPLFSTSRKKRGSTSGSCTRTSRWRWRWRESSTSASCWPTPRTGRFRRPSGSAMGGATSQCSTRRSGSVPAR